MNSPDSDDTNDAVARRVRRAVGFKVMRDLHKVAHDQQRDDQQRPWLLLKLLLIIVVLALIGVALLRLI